MVALLPLHRWPNLMLCAGICTASLLCGGVQGIAVGQETPTLTEAEQRQLIDEFGSPVFAEREEATQRARQQGIKIIGPLREAAKSHPDPEVRARANALYTRVVDGDFEARAAAFMAGDPIGENFPGWQYVQTVMDDCPELRELFLETSRRHPRAMEALDGDSRARRLELDLLAHRLRTQQYDNLQVPTKEDVLPLIWTLADPRIPISVDVHKLCLSLMNKAAANELRTDAQLGPPFRRLVGSWVRRSPVDYAEKTLALAKQWNLESDGMVLSQRAAFQSRERVNIHAGIVGIAKFGAADDVSWLIPFFADNDPLTEAEMGEATLEVRTSDVAMAGIAYLYKVPLKEIGFADANEHPIAAFDPESVGFKKGEETAREKVRKKVKALIEERTGKPVYLPEPEPEPNEDSD